MEAPVVLEAPVVETKNNKKVNPFDEGVSYAAFLEALGKSDIEKYLKEICTEEQIEFVKKELKLL